MSNNNISAACIEKISIVSKLTCALWTYLSITSFQILTRLIMTVNTGLRVSVSLEIKKNRYDF